MKVLVTGVAGFLGAHLARRLVARGDEVVGLDNFDPLYPRVIKEHNLRPLRGQARLVEGDVLDAGLLDSLLSKGDVDVVAHLAALAGVRPSLREPRRYQRVNVEGSCMVAEAAARHGVGKLVFASSSSVYGAQDRVPFAETDAADAPQSPYAASKRGAELVLRSLAHTTGLSVTALRYFTVYGPRQRPEMAVATFCRAIDAGETITLFGRDTSRDYTYVSDAIDATVAAIDRSPPGFRIYNVGSGRPAPLDTLVELIGAALGRQPNVIRAPEALGDVPRTFAAIAAARADLGWAPRVELAEGVARYVASYRSGGEPGADLP